MKPPAGTPGVSGGFLLTLNAQECPFDVYCRNNDNLCLKNTVMRGFVTTCVVKRDVMICKSVEKCPLLKGAAWRLRYLREKNLAQTQFSGRKGPFPCSKFFSAGSVIRTEWLFEGFPAQGASMAPGARNGLWKVAPDMPGFGGACIMASVAYFQAPGVSGSHKVRCPAFC